MDCNKIKELFQMEMFHNEIVFDDEINCDGQIHRIHIQGDKSGSQNGWYFLRLYPSVHGVYGNWKTGSKFTWFLKNSGHRLKKDVKPSSLVRNSEKLQQKIIISNQVTRIYQLAEKALSVHPYLKRKNIAPLYSKQIEQKLILPIIDLDFRIWSLQYIFPNGKKRFHFKGKIKSNFIPIQINWDVSKKIYICEGFATGATLLNVFKEASIIAAAHAGNLKPCAQKIQTRFPSHQIIICADDDQLNPENPGLKKAYEAALATNAFLIKPDWPLGAPKDLSDFNDLWLWQQKKLEIEI